MVVITTPAPAFGSSLGSKAWRQATLRRLEKGEAIRDSSPASWLRCYRCWSQNLEVQVHYEGIFKVDSCTVIVEADAIESCSGPEAAEHLTHGAFGEAGAREFFTHVRFHKHEGERIVVHMLAELYARSAEEAAGVLEEAARGELAISSLAEESRPPAATGDDPSH